MNSKQQQALILNQHQAEAVYSAMCALNNLGRVGGSVIIPKEPDQRDEPRVTWNFLGVTVYQDLTFLKEYYADQAAFAAAYGLDIPALQPFTVFHIVDDTISVDHVRAACAAEALQQAQEQGLIDPVVFAGHIVAQAFA